MRKGYMYILKCADGSYYTGSTTDLARRLAQHQAGEGANHTKKRLPVKLVYFEEFQRIDEAFYREKQVQGWSRKKKEALINGKAELLPKLAMAYRDIKGGFENYQGGFENLSHPEGKKPNSVSSLTSMPDMPKPEALEGEALEGEALEGSGNKNKKTGV